MALQYNFTSTKKTKNIPYIPLLNRYAGINCQTNIDDCVSSPCQNGGRCIDRVAGYVCGCLPMWTGPHCEMEVDECDSNPCQNNAPCRDLLGIYRCDCLSGYTGERFFEKFKNYEPVIKYGEGGYENNWKITGTKLIAPPP